MAKYQFKAKDEEGKPVDFELEAANETELQAKAESMGLFITEIALQGKKQGGGSLFGPPKVKLKDLAVFSWQLFTMLNSSMTLLEALNNMITQTKNVTLRKSITNIASQVEQGVSFAEALQAEKKVFPPLFIQMVGAGERAGILEKIMQRLSEFMDYQAKTRSQIKSAMSYPTILLFISIAVTLFLMIVILPRFQSMFEGMESEPPMITMVLLTIGLVLKKYFLLIGGGVVAAVFGIKYFLKTPQGIVLKDNVSLKAPVLGPLMNMSIVSGFAKTFSSLLEADMPLVEALNITAGTISNSLVRDAVTQASEKIARGDKVADSLAHSGLFSAMVINMVSLGERTGKLADTMSKVADFYERELDEAIDNFTKMIEPIFLVGMAVLVGTICLSIFLPLTSVMQDI